LLRKEEQLRKELRRRDIYRATGKRRREEDKVGVERQEQGTDGGKVSSERDKEYIFIYKQRELLRHQGKLR